MERQSLISGALILGFAGILTRFLGIFFRWPLIMLIGDEGVGYYQMSYPLYMFFIAIASGIPVAISKMISERNAVNDMQGAILIVRKALLMMLVLGGGFTFLLILNSKFLIGFLKWDEKSLYALLGIAFAPLFISIMSVFRGFYQGMQNMIPTAISEIIEQLGRIVVGISLAYILMPRGIEYSAGGAAFGAAAGGILALIYLVINFIKVNIEPSWFRIKNDPKTLRRILKIAVPISLGATVGTIMSLIDSIIVPQNLLKAGFNSRDATIFYGQLTGKAFVLMNVPLTLSIALSYAIIPSLSREHILHNINSMLNKIHMALKFSLVIAIPSFLGLYFMASPIMALVFPGHGEGYLLLKYLSISIPFIVLAQSTTAILQSIGEYMAPIANLALGCIVKIVISFILVGIPTINIYGAIIGTVIGYLIACSLNLLYMRKTLGIRINLIKIAIKPLIAAIGMINIVVFIYLNVYNITKSNGIACVFSINSGMLIYIVLIIALGVFRYDYLKKSLGKLKERKK